MRPTGKVLAVLLMLALAAPAAVLAQSAGDEQYVDPFQGQGDGSGGGDNGDQSDSGSAPAAETSPTEDTAGATAESTVSDTATLPRTGLTLLPVVVAGLFLLSAGFAGRRLTAVPGTAAPGGLVLPSVPRAVAPRAAATAPARGRLPAIGLGLVGLLILSLLRRRA
jgi:hypothetical protein